MPSPVRTIPLTLDSTNRAAGPVPWAWQASPLILTGTLCSDLITGAASLRAEIHATGTAPNAAPLATKTVAVTGDTAYEWEFSTAEMTLELEDGAETLNTWLIITAVDEDGLELQPLYRSRLEILINQYSGAAAQTPLDYLVSGTPDANGLYTFRGRGYTWKLPLIGFTPATDADAGGFARLQSTTPDDEGLHTFTAAGHTWKLALIGFAPASS